MSGEEEDGDYLEDVAELEDSGSEYDPSSCSQLSDSDSPLSSDHTDSPTPRGTVKRKKKERTSDDPKTRGKKKTKKKRPSLLRRPAARPVTRTNRVVRKVDDKDEDTGPLVSKPTGRIGYENFDRYLSDVVFSMSGYVNPLRSQLRSQAVEMGAVYRPDWDNSCTHLLCAFPNTPKYYQAKGRGKIVSKDWIEDGFTERKRFPWRRYAVDRCDRGVDESEDEIQEICSIVVDQDLHVNILDLDQDSRPDSETTVNETEANDSSREVDTVNENSISVCDSEDIVNSQS